MKTKTTMFSLVSLVLLSLMVILSALFFYPFGHTVPHRDYGIYLYLGKELLAGKTIYSEIWEHKPVMIFYINALGLSIAKGSDWGVWGLELVFLLLTVGLSFFTLRRKLHPIASMFITMAAFLTSFHYMEGNYTEEYALLFQSAILFVFLSQRFKKSELRNYFIIGVLTGISFNFKQTYIDVTAAIGILLILEMFIEKRWFNLRSIACLGVGFLFPNFIMIIIMALNGVVKNWWEAAYIFNISYSDISFIERIKALIIYFHANSNHAFFIIAFVTWLGSLLFLLYFRFYHQVICFLTGRKGRIFLLVNAGSFTLLFVFGQFMESNKPGIGLVETFVLVIILLSLLLYFLFSFIIKQHKEVQKPKIQLTDWLPNNDCNWINIYDPLLLGIVHYPIVILLATTSGRNYPHYLIPLYSSVFLLFSGIYLSITKFFQKSSKLKLPMLGFLLLFLVGAAQPGKQVLQGLQKPYTLHPYRELVQYIVENSKEGDQVFVWGLEPMINYLSNRSSPSRFSYVDPVYDLSPMKEKYIKILLHELSSNPPKFLLDMRDPHYPFIDGRSNEICLEIYPDDGTDLDRIIHFICKNYQHIDRINGVEVYKIIAK